MKKFLLSFIMIAIFLPFSFASADIASQIRGGNFFEETLDKSGIATTAEQKDSGGKETIVIAQKVGKVIQNVLQFLGVIILIMIIYAGILWLTAGGNSEKAQKAQKILFNSFIGALIIGSAYALSAAILLATQ